MITHASLFSGIGGPDLAADEMGWENLFHCEINSFGQRILKYYWPNATSYSDITKTDFSIWRGRVDVLTGGFPCQGFSLAGKREGTNDNRYLWPAMLDAIKAIRPTWVIGENVTGITSMEDKSGVWSEVFAKVESRKIVRYDTIDHYEAIYTRQAKMLIATICENLEEEGYSVQPFAIPAGSVGAPHKRERIWFVAHAKNAMHSRCVHRETEKEGAKIRQFGNAGTGSCNGVHCQPGDAQNSNINRVQGREKTRPKGTKPFNSSNDEPNANPNMLRSKGNEKMAKRQPEQRNGFCVRQNDSNCNCQRLQRGDNQGAVRRNRAERAQQPSRLFLPKWHNFPTQPPICSRNDGLPSRLDGITVSNWRTESIKGYGNAIVPQVMLEFFKAIDQIMREN